MRNHSKKVRLTFSLPIELSKELIIYVKPHERSHFVAEAIKKELKRTENKLRRAYLCANKDIGQQETICGDWFS